MNPDAIQAALLQAVETKAAKDRANAEEYAGALRQIIAKGMKVPTPEPAGEVLS